MDAIPGGIDNLGILAIIHDAISILINEIFSLFIRCKNTVRCGYYFNETKFSADIRSQRLWLCQSGRARKVSTATLVSTQRMARIGESSGYKAWGCRDTTPWFSNCVSSRSYMLTYEARVHRPTLGLHSDLSTIKGYPTAIAETPCREGGGSG